MSPKIYSRVPEHLLHSLQLQLFFMFYPEFLDSLECTRSQICST